MKIGLILGTYAEYIKCVPIMLELKKQKIDYELILTGQHSIIDLNKTFDLKKPHTILTKPKKSKKTKFYSKKNSIIDVFKSILWCLKITYKIRKEVKKQKFDYVIYQGDTMSTCCSAIASSKFLNPFKKFKTAYVEAGLRSYDLKNPFPEEISRRICSILGDILLTVSKETHNNIKREKKLGKPYLVGNTIVDITLLSIKKAKKRNFKTPKKGYILCTFKNFENINNKKRLEKIIEILESYNYPTILLLYDQTRKKLERFNLFNRLKKIKHVKIMNPLKEYLEFLIYFNNSKLILTDSRGIQEETLVLKKPCVLLRKKSERTEGLKTGINFLTNFDVKYIKGLMKKLLSKNYKLPKFKNPYGDGKTSKRIVHILKKDYKKKD